jgi:hypothetical protein
MSNTSPSEQGRYLSDFNVDPTFLDLNQELGRKRVQETFLAKVCLCARHNSHPAKVYLLEDESLVFECLINGWTYWCSRGTNFPYEILV